MMGRFLIRQGLVGAAVAVILVAALIGFDVARLGTLMRGSPSGLFAAGVLTLMLAGGFASAQMAFALMLMEGEPRGALSRRQAGIDGG